MLSRRIQRGVLATTDRAIYLEEHETLVLSDLHLGLEGAMQASGVEIPRYQGPLIRAALSRLLKEFSPRLVVIDGDFKHSFDRNLAQEWTEAKEVLRLVRASATIHLVRGNHDNFLATIARSANVPLDDSLQLGRFQFVHGHVACEPPPNAVVVVGHEHPALVLRDEVGGRVKIPCYLVSDALIALPAFSPLAEGADVVRNAGRAPEFSPLLSRVDPDRTKVVGISEEELLDFATLGQLRNLDSSF